MGSDFLPCRSSTWRLEGTGQRPLTSSAGLIVEPVVARSDLARVDRPNSWVASQTVLSRLTVVFLWSSCRLLFFCNIPWAVNRSLCQKRIKPFFPFPSAVVMWVSPSRYLPRFPSFCPFCNGPVVRAGRTGKAAKVARQAAPARYSKEVSFPAQITP